MSQEYVKCKKKLAEKTILKVYRERLARNDNEVLINSIPIKGIKENNFIPFHLDKAQVSQNLLNTDKNYYLNMQIYYLITL